jgi:hypothetical protein
MLRDLGLLALPALAMSVGWGLRGTIGGGPVGAMIPGAMVSLCLCVIVRWSRSVGVATAFGAVGVGLGGQMTYGQTIGFAVDPDTWRWGLLGLTVKGAVWGFSGGLLVGLGLHQSRHRRGEIVAGLLLMVAGTAIGWALIDRPKYFYFSNRLDQPREEVWVGLLVGALALLVYLVSRRRELVSAGFAGLGALSGAAGFGGGGLFMVASGLVPDAHRAWPWWKSMELTFGLLFGLGLGYACLRHQRSIEELDGRDFPHPGDPFDVAPAWVRWAAGLALVVGGLYLQFSVPFRAMYTLVGSGVLLLALLSCLLAWQVALGMTICGFVRDFFYAAADREWIDAWWVDSPRVAWTAVLAMALPIVVAICAADGRKRLSARSALLAITWSGFAFGMIKIVPHVEITAAGLFVPAAFALLSLGTTYLSNRAAV